MLPVDFDELGRSVVTTWRSAGGQPERFADVAVDALSAARLHVRLRHEDVLRWAIQAPRLPRQASQDFGEPPLTVFDDGEVFIQVLTWLDGTTSIHDHGFAGAFCLLQGASCHTRYAFRSQGVLSLIHI